MTDVFVLIEGSDEYLIERELKSLLTGSEVVKLDGATVTSDGLNAAFSPDLFVSEKDVVVSSAEKLPKPQVELIKSFLSSPPGGISVFLLGSSKAKTVLKDLTLRKVSTPKVSSLRDRTRFVKETARELGCRLTEGAATSLALNAGDGLRSVKGALVQLSSQKDGVLDEDYVALFYASNPETTGFTVAEKAFSSLGPDAFKALREALNAGVAPVLISSALISQARDLTRLIGLGSVSADEAATVLGMPSWKVEKSRRLLRGWDAQGLAKAFEASLLTERAVKGSNFDVGYALEKAVEIIVSSRR